MIGKHTPQLPVWQGCAAQGLPGLGASAGLETSFSDLGGRGLTTLVQAVPDPTESPVPKS